MVSWVDGLMDEGEGDEAGLEGESGVGWEGAVARGRHVLVGVANANTPATEQRIYPSPS